MQQFRKIALAFLVLGVLPGLSRGQEKESPSVKELIEIVKSSAPDKKRMQAVMALKELGPKAKDAVPALADVLRKERSMVSYYALSALSKIGTDAVKDLIDVMNDENAKSRLSAVQALAEMDPLPEAAMKALQEAKTSKDKELSSSADFWLQAVKKRNVK